MTNSERIHQLADSHAQGTHDSDPQFDCYDCYPWTTGYGAQVLASLSANTYGDFGSLEDYSPSQMAKRIWDGIKDGVGVTIYKENQ